MSEQLKRDAAAAALETIEAGMKVGLGSGSTSAIFVDLLCARVRDGLDIRCAATSEVIAAQARAGGIRVFELDDLNALDVTVDGADELDWTLRLIKGGGGALVREKIVAGASERMIVIAHGSKKVEMLGAYPLPIEVVTFACETTLGRIRSALGDLDLAGDTRFRQETDGQRFVTDNGNVIVDAALGRIPDPESLERVLNGLPGVVDCGLFLGMATEALIASETGVERITRPAA